MIQVYCSTLTSRTKYAFQLIFETLLQSRVTFYSQLRPFEQSRGVKINYSEGHISGALNLRPEGLLDEDYLRKEKPEVTSWDNEFALFPVVNSFIPFDLFAASFYLVTRYEEYRSSNLDHHQRYRAGNSILSKNGVLEIPVVNRWAVKLASLLEQQFPEYHHVPASFSYLPSIDIDNAWAFKHKHWGRLLLSSGRDLLKNNRRVMVKRLRVVTGIDADPYDNYHYLQQLLQQHELPALFFILLNNKGKYDRALSPRNRHLQKLIKQLNSWAMVAIHPSYMSNTKKGQLDREIKLLQRITGKPVQQSRQHFLKLRWPDTYRSLIQSGIRSEYSMGYASHPGFRAGIASPYPFYDLVDESEKPLMIYPFAVMDVTLRQYRKMSPREAGRKIEKLMHETASVGGTFISLWHNESLGNEGYWDGWRAVYDRMTQLAVSLLKAPASR